MEKERSIVRGSASLVVNRREGAERQKQPRELLEHRKAVGRDLGGRGLPTDAL